MGMGFRYSASATPCRSINLYAAPAPHSLKMELSEFQKKVVEHLLLAPPPGKHAARSALRHLERAWQLAAGMPEIAAFLAITAEEESASAVFHSLKRRGYKGSDNLNLRSHIHKSALHPFLLAVGRVAETMYSEKNATLTFSQKYSADGKERLLNRLTVKDNAGNQLFAYPTPPLNFTISENDVPYNFKDELQAIASEKNSRSILEYVKKLANRRNQSLYAAANGIPHTKDSVSFLEYRRQVVFSHFIAFLMIDPYPQTQLFVQQALDAFTEMLKRMPGDS
jgi:hypothetical protein